MQFSKIVFSTNISAFLFQQLKYFQRHPTLKFFSSLLKNRATVFFICLLLWFGIESCKELALVYNCFCKKQQTIEQMSNIEQLDRYINPPIPVKNDTIYKSYSHFSSIGQPAHEEQVIYVQHANPADYPRTADYSRIPVMVNCENCQNLGMTEIQYTHGSASKWWCFLLLPFLCTGACCLCLNSCKDVEHKCNKCHQRVGLNQSSCC